MPLLNSQQLLDKLEKTVLQTIEKASDLRSFGEVGLTKQPAPGKWNVLQVLHHLNSYNNYYLPQIDAVIKKGINVPATSSFKPGLLGNYFANTMLPGNNGLVTNTMKAPADHTPPATFNDVNAIAAFIAGQNKLLQHIAAARNVNMTRLTVPISISKFIKIRLGDTFRFLIAHQQRHFVQINNTLKAIGVTSAIETL